MTELSQDQEIDEVLYSRQIFALGIEALAKLSVSSILISGMGGLGVEIAKNVILSGVKNVTIHDTRNVEIDDLASNFYLSEKSIGKNRAIESFTQLSKLNKYVNVQVKTENLTNDLIKKFNYNCVVITDFLPESEINSISTICHQNSIKLIITETRGLFAYIFNDFGSNYIVENPKGIHPSRLALGYITRSEHGLVSILSSEMKYEMNYEDGDHVTFEEVEGMTEINGKEFEVKVINDKQFTIGDTRSFSEYTSVHNCGYVKEVIVPKKFEFLEFTEALKTPSTRKLCNDKNQQVILAFISAQHSLDTSHKNTREITGDELMQSAKEINSIYKIVDKIDEKLIREFARESLSVICPLCSIIGGIVSQEIIKSLSSEFSQIQQFLAIEFTSTLPKNVEYELKNDRYDPYRIIFGNKQQEIIENLRFLVTGLGSNGCEQLKNLAMMGVATSKDRGHLYLTDFKSIKKSDLSREFLFHEENIGENKCDIALQSIQMLNPNINVTFQNNKVDFKETNNSFEDRFYQNLDGIMCSEDIINEYSVLYENCIINMLPLLITHNIGMKSYYKSFIPKITKNIPTFVEQPKEIIERSAANLFPCLFNQLCEWSINLYNMLFERQPENVCFLSNIQPNDFDKEDTFKSIKDALGFAESFFNTGKCENFDDCIKWATVLFDEIFVDEIEYKLKYHSTDNSFNGERKLPRVAVFDPKNHYHIQFIKSASLLRAKVCQIEPQKADFSQIDPNLKYSDYKNTNDWYFNDELAKQRYNKILPFIKNSHINPESLINKENDDDDYSSLWFQFIESVVNIRAFNYKIKLEDKREIKRFFRNINPSIITLSSIITGFTSLEMYKIFSIDKDKKINDANSIRMATAINLTSPIYIDLDESYNNIEENEAKESNHSIWNKKIIIEGDLTFDEFIKEVYEKYNIIIDFINYGHTIFNLGKCKEILYTKISDYMISQFGLQPFSEGKYYIKLECLYENDDDDDGDDDDTKTFYLKIK